MNRIVRDNYPVANLPESLREGLGDLDHVRVVIEAESAAGGDGNLVNPALTPPDHVMSLDELFAMRRPPYRTTEEIVADIRRQRDEWDTNTGRSDLPRPDGLH